MPTLIALAVIGLACVCEMLPELLPRAGHPGESRLGLFRRLEWITYDWRMRIAAASHEPAASNLAAVLIDDVALDRVNQQTGYYWPWPRQLFGRVVRELVAQGARAVACDVFFLERHPDFAETRVSVSGGRVVASDEFFAQQLRSAGNVILGCPGQIVSNRWLALPPVIEFRTNALAIGCATTDRDVDGVLRRARPYRDDPQLGRVWHLGLCLAAVGLGLDLDRAEVEPRQIVLRGPGDVRRSIPLDNDGLFYIDWSLAWNDRRLVHATFEELLEFDQLRESGQTRLESAFQGRLAVIGSIGAGSNVSDVGATPLQKETYLVSQHWNVANSMITGRFLRPASAWGRLGLVILVGAVSAVLTWRMRARLASGLVGIVLIAYVACGVWLFVRLSLWIPLVVPAGVAGFMTHVGLMTWRAVFEQSERRRVKSIFARIVAPEIVTELLHQERLALGGTLRPVTVLFADIRGFTRLTDERQRAAEAYAREHGLTGAAAEAWFEQNARETLETVNRYLAAVAETVKRHHGTLDKYIGDCVMAFWGAPVPNKHHAVDAVRAAIDSQRAIARLNTACAGESSSRANQAAGEASPHPTLSPLAALSLGTGINTGTVTVGLMGSASHTFNYTVFGREVNLASRLESVSGHGRIIISGATCAELRLWAPDLAARCLPLPAVVVKGISEPVEIHEVPWREEPEAG